MRSPRWTPSMISGCSLTYWSVGDVQMRIPLAREHPSVALDEHKAARRSGQGVLGWVTVNMQDIGCVTRSNGIHNIEGVLTDAPRHYSAYRDASLNDRVEAILS